MVNLPIDSALFQRLDREPRGRRLRLPLRLDRRPGRQRTCLKGSDLTLDLDTSALSMGLDLHLQPHLDDEGAAYVWVEGTWGPLLRTPTNERPVFTVRRIVGACSDPRPQVLLL